MMENQSLGLFGNADFDFETELAMCSATIHGLRNLDLLNTNDLIKDLTNKDLMHQYTQYRDVDGVHELENSLYFDYFSQMRAFFLLVTYYAEKHKVDYVTFKDVYVHIGNPVSILLDSTTVLEYKNTSINCEEKALNITHFSTDDLYELIELKPFLLDELETLKFTLEMYL